MTHTTIPQIDQSGFYPPYLMERFWAKVERCAHGSPCKGCCWLWQGSSCRGYGTFSIPKAYRVLQGNMDRANRVCWRMFHGNIPDGLHVLHNCPSGDNPRCVNPHHLWIGTIDDNQKDSMRKGRRPRGDHHGLRLHPEAIRRGEANPASRTTAEKVLEIFTARASGLLQSQIAVLTGVPRGTVSSILRRNSWGHISIPSDLLAAAEKINARQRTPSRAKRKGIEKGKLV